MISSRAHIHSRVIRAAKGSSLTPVLSRQQARGFFGIPSPVASSSGGVFVTKYEITKPGKEGHEWDDFLLAHPERDALATTGKEVPLFLKYLKVVTDKEGRSADFQAFLKRAKDGLSVESDVFLTTEELLAVMWKNGFLDNERNSLQFTFPSDYKFHYPELAVLFDLSEEDCYKYCMRQRMEKSHIGELKTDKVARKGWVRDHWLLFGTGAFLFKTFPFFNYYFVLKGFGTAMWCWSVYTAGSRWFSGVVARNEFAAKQKTAADVLAGEDAILAAMQRFANDAKCLEGVESFGKGLESEMEAYREGLILLEKEKVVAKAGKQLAGILAAEEAGAAKLQEGIIREIAGEFREKFGNNKDMQGKAIDSAIAAIANRPSADPVAAHFLTSLQSLKLSPDATQSGNAKGTISERVQYILAEQEREFVKQFYISPEEIAAAKSGANPEATMAGLMSKVGYHVPSLGVENWTPTSTSGGYGDEVSKEVGRLDAVIKKQREEGFKAAFA